MKVWRLVHDFVDWLPILLAPFAVYWLTGGFAKSLSSELWVVIGLAVMVNLGWIAFVRWNRQMVAFRERYPGFRMKK